MYSKIIRGLQFWKGRIVVITDTNVAALYAEPFCAEFKANTVLLKIPPGEASKSRHIKEVLEDQLIDEKIGRSDLLVAFGGGVVSDVVGYLAATYLRGIQYVTIPTTLMGMVDAAIGGKNGINHEKGKNLMGSLYAPMDVFIEPAFLKSLPNETFREGFIEVIKCGLIWDLDLLSRIEKKEISEKEYIDRSIQIKRLVVKKDPNDLGLRKILNYGHLVAHAIEKCTSYAISHGRAVWFGLLVESYISHLKGFLSWEDVERIAALLLREDIRFSEIPGIVPEIVYEAMRNDKKAKGNMPRVVLLKRIGKVASFGGEYCTPLDYADFMAGFSWVSNLIAYPRETLSLTR